MAVKLVTLVVVQAMLALPGPVRDDLAALCPGWRLAPVTPEVGAEIASRTPDWPANLIRGDFDGDASADFAVLAECPQNGLSTVQLLVFMSDGETFRRAVIEPPAPPDAREFLHLIPAGAGGGYQRDAIGVEYDAIGGHAWVLRNGKWQSIPRA